MAKDVESQDVTEDQSSTALPAVGPLDRARREAQLRSYRSLDFKELGRQAVADGVQVVSAAEAGIGFKLIENKKDKVHLVGVELAVLPGWQVNPSTKWPGRYFVSAYIKTARPVEQLGNYQEFILNDGSTGIAMQLADLRARARAANEPDPLVHCRRGLKRSTYEVMDDLIDEATGQPIIDPVTERPKRVKRLDPVTGEPVGEGETFYLDTSV